MKKQRRDDYTVGYGKPPVEHQFKPGTSGNPKGRSPRIMRDGFRGGNTELSRLLEREMKRTISVNENGRLTEEPMISVILRKLAIKAAGGDYKSQAYLLNSVQENQIYNKDVEFEAFKFFADFKTSLEEEFQECDDASKPRPEVFPHPDDIMVDYKEGSATINGPMTKEDDETWERAQVNIDKLYDKIDKIRRRRGSQPDDEARKEAETAELYEKIDLLDYLYPDKETRRRSGFNLYEWRKTHRALARILEGKQKKNPQSGEDTGSYP